MQLSFSLLDLAHIDTAKIHPTQASKKNNSQLYALFIRPQRLDQRTTTPQKRTQHVTFWEREAAANSSTAMLPAGNYVLSIFEPFFGATWL